eukprot:Lankesteria_metandrocarpae@DN11132_c0_g1_i1.p1
MSAVLWDVENRFPNCSDGCWTVEEFNICKQRGLANAIEHKKGSYVEGNSGYCWGVDYNLYACEVRTWDAVVADWNELDPLRIVTQVSSFKRMVTSVLPSCLFGCRSYTHIKEQCFAADHNKKRFKMDRRTKLL